MGPWVPAALLSHPQEMENPEGKLPNAPEKLSEGMDEKLMWVINIAREDAPDTIKFREKPAAVEGEVLWRGRGGERGGPHRGSAVSLPGSGTPRSSEMLLLLSDTPDGTELQVSTWWRSRGQRCSICLSLRAPSLGSFRLPQAERQVSPRKAEVSAGPPDPG